MSSASDERHLPNERFLDKLGMTLCQSGRSTPSFRPQWRNLSFGSRLPAMNGRAPNERFLDKLGMTMCRLLPMNGPAPNERFLDKSRNDVAVVCYRWTDPPLTRDSSTGCHEKL